uniref:Uncharacterized protein n=2 Tax=Oryza meridionalis TaxID=40149 RepID=A0A0E0CLA1_9ORYZ
MALARDFDMLMKLYQEALDLESERSEARGGVGARRKEERKSGYPKEKLLESSMRSYQGPAKEEKLPMGDAVYYYFKDIYDALRIAQVGVRLMFLDRDYSEFRPVVPDEECFYRSFLFSYLEQVVDRIDTLWENRLLAAIRELDRRAERDAHRCYTIVA